MVFSIIMKFVMASVILLMLSVGMRTTVKQLLEVLRNTRLLVIGMLVNFIAAPALMYLCIHWLPINIDVQIAIILMAAAPIAPMAPVPFVEVAKGDVRYSAGLMIIAASLSIIMIPVILFIMLPSNEGGLTIDIVGIVRTVLVVQLIPITAGILLLHYKPDLNRKLNSFVPKAGQIGLLVSLVFLLVYQFRFMITIGIGGFLINLAVVLLCLGIGHAALSRDTGERRRALAVSTTVRNIPLAFLLANSNFPDSAVAPSTLVFATFSMIAAVIYGRIATRKEQD